MADTQSDLQKLLKPRTIAVVGASENISSFGGGTCQNIMDYSDPERFFFVNPKYQTLFGRKCYAKLAEIPDPVDLVVICTPQSTVNGLLREAAQKGVKAAVIYASGYSEVGTPEGKAAQEELVALCKELGIVMMGPNCGGFINFIDQLHAFAFISDKRERLGSVGLVSQSGQTCLSSLDSPAIRFSYAISAGNCAAVNMEDFLSYLVDDPETKVVAMFLEGVRDPGKLVVALRKAAQIRKPVVIFKIGRSAKGSATAASHTGSLSGSDATFDALFKKFGVIRVNDLQELISTSLTLATWPMLPLQPTVASMNLSGGETGTCADLGDIYGLNYPDFNAATIAKLEEHLPFFATPRNPLDMTAALAYDVDKYAAVLRAVMADPAVGMVMVGYTLLYTISDPAIHYMTEAMEQVLAGNDPVKPVVILPFVENTRNPEYLYRLNNLGVPILPPPQYGLSIIRKILDYTQYKPEEHTLEVVVPYLTCLPKQGQPRTLSEFESMRLLSEYGIRVPKGGVATSALEATQIAEQIGISKGKRIALKIASEDIPHKTEAGGVRLNLHNKQEIEEAFTEIIGSCLTYAPKARIDGVFVQEMLEPGLEMIVGVKVDPQFGPQILCGLGGIFVELYRDVALYPAPLSKDEAMRMLKTLKAYPVLAGFRGQAGYDLDALAQTIVAVGNFAVTKCDVLHELDINPLFVYPEGRGVCAADAMLVLNA